MFITLHLQPNQADAFGHVSEVEEVSIEASAVVVIQSLPDHGGCRVTIAGALDDYFVTETRDEVEGMVADALGVVLNAELGDMLSSADAPMIATQLAVANDYLARMATALERIATALDAIRSSDERRSHS